MAINPEIRLLLDMLDEAFDRKAWHGTTLKGSLRGLSFERAAWRPAPSRHNIWEIVVHAAYWKYAVRRRLLGAKRGSFSIKGSNWFVLPASLSRSAWRRDVAILDLEHRRLRNAVQNLDPAKLHLKSAGSKNSNATLIRGIASHDLYHAGQIQLLKRLQS